MECAGQGAPASPSQMFGFRAGRQCLDTVSYLVEGLREAEEWGEKLFAFDAVRPELLGDAILSRGGLGLFWSSRGKGELEFVLPSEFRACLV